MLFTKLRKSLNCFQVCTIEKCLMAVEIIPAYLLEEGKHDEGLIFIDRLPVDPPRKKELYVQYMQVIGAVIDREYVKKVLGRLPEWMEV